MNKWEECLGRHRGEKFVVVGLSPLSVNNAVENCVTIGVNDVKRYRLTDYTVVVDPQTCFKKDRWEYITTSESKAVFSQYDIPHPNLCKIRLNPRRGSYLTDSEKIDISYTSTFVGCNIAYWMGASKIGIIGQDHTDPKHSLNGRLSDVLAHVGDLRDNLKNAGVELVSLSEHSRLNDVLRYDVSF